MRLKASVLRRVPEGHPMESTDVLKYRERKRDRVCFSKMGISGFPADISRHLLPHGLQDVLSLLLYHTCILELYLEAAGRQALATGIWPETQKRTSPPSRYLSC